MDRRNVLAMMALAGVTMAALEGPARGSEACGPADRATESGAALLERYVAAVNAHDATPFSELFTSTYIQHSGRSPSGLAAQIENFRRIVASMPDVRMRVEDRIIAADRVVARTTYSATHTRPIRGVPPTGKAFTFRTIDIWRVENGKFAEHWDLTDAADVVRQLGGE
jgi:steroid delta-isomerase-like uncharacterized protein